MTLYRRIDNPLEAGEPVQFVGVYVTKWGQSDVPSVGFVEDESVDDLVEACELGSKLLMVLAIKKGEANQEYTKIVHQMLDAIKKVKG